MGDETVGSGCGGSRSIIQWAEEIEFKKMFQQNPVDKVSLGNGLYNRNKGNISRHA